jgi:hypothetical protein
MIWTVSGEQEERRWLCVGFPILAWTRAREEGREKRGKLNVIAKLRGNVGMLQISIRKLFR